MNKPVSAVLLFALALILTSCSGQTDVVDSGTYTGQIEEVKPEESEIYLAIDEGRTLELYFIEETTLTRGGSEVPFSELAAGQRVEVEVERVGNRLDPLSVEILE